MFGPSGIAYVYLVYGMYDCLNVVTGTDGTAAAVLIRAVEPLTGIESMRMSRKRRTAVPDERLASGPGLVGAAFGLDRSWTGRDLCDPASPLRIEADGPPVAERAIRATPRIGIGYAGEPWASVPWRLVVAGHPSVSGTRSSR